MTLHEEDETHTQTQLHHQQQSQWLHKIQPSTTPPTDNPISITAQASNTTTAKNPNPPTYKCIENPSPQQTQTQKSLDRRPNITKSQN